MRDVVGYERLYAVTDDGRVWVYFRKGKGSNKTGRFFTPAIDIGGYNRINLRKNGVSKSFSVHRLVAQEYISNPKNLPEINHKDGNKSNNKVKNLEWCTRNFNMKHAFSIGKKTHMGENNPRNILSVYQIKKIKMIGKKIGQQEIARRFGVSRSCIQHILSGYTWSKL